MFEFLVSETSCKFPLNFDIKAVRLGELVGQYIAIAHCSLPVYAWIADPTDFE